MFRPPLDPRTRPLIERPTWGKVIVSYAVMAAIPLLLWVGSHPLVGLATLAGVAALLVAGRRAHRLLRCFHECPGITFELAGTARITVSQIAADDAT